MTGNEALDNSIFGEEASDCFVSEEELRLMQKDESVWEKLSAQARQSSIDSDWVELVDHQRHPDRYIRDVLDFNLWTCPSADDQLDIVHAIHDHERVTVRSGNGVGKTGVAGRIILWYLYNHYPSIVITTASVGRQVEKQIWGETRKAFRGAKVDLGGQLLNTELKIEEDWYAMGFSTDEPEKLAGFHSPNMLVVVDEPGKVPEGCFEAVEGLLTTEKAKLLLIGNPLDPTSYFGRTHLHPRESRSWVKLHIDCWNTPNVRAGRNIIPALVAHDWPRKRLEEWGEYNPFYQVRVKGDFPDTGDKNLIPYHMVHSALERTIRPAGRKILAIDVAQFGQDKSVIGRLWGNQFRVLKKYWKLDGPALANKTVKVLDEGEKDIDEIRVDAIGWGADCYTSLRDKKKGGTNRERELLKDIKVVPVNVSEKVKSPKARKSFYNVRAEAGYSVRQMFEEGQIDIDDEDLGVQLANIWYDFKDGRWILEDKEKFKTRARVRPDELDSLLIAKAIVRGGVPSIW